jgi:two-component system, sensor histidine kinase RpfC
MRQTILRERFHVRTTVAPWTTRVGWTYRVTLAPRLELEQAGLRLGIGVVLLVVLVLRLVGQSKPSAELSQMVWLLAGFVAIAVAITLWTLAGPQVSPTRRILGIVADNAAITWFMLLMGESGVLVVGIYMLVAFGNAFRFGRLYLRISHFAALLGFSLVLYFSEFWSRHVLIGLGLFNALLILPLYVGVLIQRLNQARLNAEQALRDCREQKERLS